MLFNVNTDPKVTNRAFEGVKISQVSSMEREREGGREGEEG